jgi:hypothetical protein
MAAQQRLGLVSGACFWGCVTYPPYLPPTVVAAAQDAVRGKEALSPGFYRIARFVASPPPQHMTYTVFAGKAVRPGLGGRCPHRPLSQTTTLLPPGGRGRGRCPAHPPIHDPSIFGIFPFKIIRRPPWGPGTGLMYSPTETCLSSATLHSRCCRRPLTALDLV